MEFSKEEISKQIEEFVLCGFDTKEEIFGRVCYYEWDKTLQELTKKIIEEKYDTHQLNSKTWSRPTDFDKLAISFDELVRMKIVSLHYAGYTNSDAISDCWEAIHTLEKIGVKSIGYCVYHAQDLLSGIKNKNLWLGFGSCDDNDLAKATIGKTIVEVLERNGFKTEWSGGVDEKITILNIDWKKVPDAQNWRMKRVINALSENSNV